MPFVKDPVRPADREEVYRRDGGCIAPLVDPNAGPCRTRWGRVCDRTYRQAFTLDHVPPSAGGTRVSRPRWMVTVCWGHHVITHWATSHRPAEREYLRKKYPDEAEVHTGDQA